MRRTTLRFSFSGIGEDTYVKYVRVFGNADEGLDGALRGDQETNKGQERLREGVMRHRG